MMGLFIQSICSHLRSENDESNLCLYPHNYTEPGVVLEKIWDRTNQHNPLLCFKYSYNILAKYYKKCRYCKNHNASSREHIIANSRSHSINKFKNQTQRNDNIQKAYKNITCKKCNNTLGQYESKSWYSLAYATIWKILAGNTNNAFKNGSTYVLKHSSKYCIESYEDRFLTLVKSKNRILPNYTFKITVDPNTLILENKPGKAVQKMVVSLTDKSDHPIKRMDVRLKPQIPDGSSGEVDPYYSQSDENGQATFNVLLRLETVKIVSEKLTIQNMITEEKIYKDIDIIIYVSIGPYNSGILIMLPLICNHNTGWYFIPLDMFHREYLKIVQDAIPDIKILTLDLAKPILTNKN